MSKLIIDNRTKTLEDHECFNYIQEVITQGKISITDGVPHYCFVTQFSPSEKGKITVYFKVNKSSGTFIVVKA